MISKIYQRRNDQSMLFFSLTIEVAMYGGVACVVQVDGGI
jgi:hypothetical protein